MNGTLVNGTVKDGVVVPDVRSYLTEGARVRILVPGPEPYPGFWDEFAAWDQVSDEAWSMIGELERSEKS